MTKYGDYFHALAVRTLHEDRLLAPRRTSLFESEFCGPEEIQPIESLVPLETRVEPIAPSRAADGPGGSLGSAPAIPESASAPTPRVEQSPSHVPAAEPTRLQPALPRLADQPVTPRIAAILPDIEAPSRRPVPALLPLREVQVTMPPAPRKIGMAAAEMRENPATPSPRSAAPSAIQHRIAAPVSSTPAPAKPAPRREPQPGALVARAAPEMRGIAPLFPAPPHAPKEPPPVEITIGRLEIRATPAKALAAANRTVPATPRHTLKEYLARNSGGRA
jgi:hypothetical protein